MDVDVKKLLHFESEHIKKLQNIVAQALKDENLIIDNLLHPPKEILTKGQKVSDKVARFGGSWAFLVLRHCKHQLL